jgi:hypothetical protein
MFLVRSKPQPLHTIGAKNVFKNHKKQHFDMLMALFFSLFFYTHKQSKVTTF